MVIWNVNQTMKVSVIITTYNRPDALGRVLEGLRLQNRHADEVIVADDGSGPETRKLVEKTAAEATWQTLHIWQEDKGFRAARIRNKAIRESSGNYIISLDGDCIPDKHFIADHRRLAQKGFFFQGKRVLIGKNLSRTFSFPQTVSLPARLRLLLCKEISNRHHLIRLPFIPSTRSTGLSGIQSCNMGFFREDLYAVNGFNEDFEGWGREDSELAVRFFALGLKRKGHFSMAICFHLWHTQIDRHRLDINDALLRKALEEGQYRCVKGLES
jgi:GT2 family glycosyltransferase